MDTGTPEETTRQLSRRLLRDGIAAARAGDVETARRLLRQATELDESNVEAWLWRSTLTDSLADKKAYLEQALALDPDNEEARAALEKVLEREGALAERAAETPLYCTVHPDRETVLRCNRCGRPMSVECAVRHPVGLRCRECVRETRSPVYNVSPAQVALALLVSTLAGAVGALVALFVSGVFWFLLLFVSPAIGGGVAAAVERAVPRKRGRALQAATVVGIVLGLVLLGLGVGVVNGQPGRGLLAVLLNLFLWLYVVLAATTAAARLR